MKTKRRVITIDEGKCDGCGACATGCHEGALQVIDGKARLVSDILCDGLGACIGECPRGAIKIKERRAEPYDEAKVMEGMSALGPDAIKAHLKHLADHGQKAFIGQALAHIKEHGIPDPREGEMTDHKERGNGSGHGPCGCPGERMMDLRGEGCRGVEGKGSAAGSQLRQWPVQLHLISPMAPYFEKADLLVAADCTAYAYGDFHGDFIKGRAMVVACPKLDDGLKTYEEKLRALIEDAGVNTVTVAQMEVPCCGGLLALVRRAAGGAGRKVPVKRVVIGVQGGIKSEEWL